MGLDSPNSRAITRAVITPAEAMSMNVIAEGVETEEQRAMLEALGCGIHQVICPAGQAGGRSGYLSLTLSVLLS
jgi:predicted signal transduction protein with EAL and GGDEF domain